MLRRNDRLWFSKVPTVPPALSWLSLLLLGLCGCGGGSGGGGTPPQPVTTVTVAPPSADHRGANAGLQRHGQGCQRKRGQRSELHVDLGRAFGGNGECKRLRDSREPGHGTHSGNGQQHYRFGNFDGDFPGSGANDHHGAGEPDGERRTNGNVQRDGNRDAAACLPVAEERREYQRCDRRKLHHSSGHSGRQRCAISRCGKQSDRQRDQHDSNADGESG